MAASPVWKVYVGKEYRAACKYIEDAAMLVAGLGKGAEIRHQHDTVVWAEGKEDQPASESYDHVADVAKRRLDQAVSTWRRRQSEQDEAARAKARAHNDMVKKVGL